jgi:hypothetical protein
MPQAIPPEDGRQSGRRRESVFIDRDLLRRTKYYFDRDHTTLSDWLTVQLRLYLAAQQDSGPGADHEPSPSQV